MCVLTDNGRATSDWQMVTWPVLVGQSEITESNINLINQYSLILIDMIRLQVTLV